MKDLRSDRYGKLPPDVAARHARRAAENAAHRARLADASTPEAIAKREREARACAEMERRLLRAANKLFGAVRAEHGEEAGQEIANILKPLFDK